MVQFNLPQNSKIEVGKYYKDKTNSKNLKKINVYRWDPSDGKNPRVDTFEVDILQYLLRWFLTMSYTLIILLILQFFFPIKRIQSA